MEMFETGNDTSVGAIVPFEQDFQKEKDMLRILPKSQFLFEFERSAIVQMTEAVAKLEQLVRTIELWIQQRAVTTPFLEQQIIEIRSDIRKIRQMMLRPLMSARKVDIGER